MRKGIGPPDIGAVAGPQLTHPGATTCAASIFGTTTPRFRDVISLPDTPLRMASERRVS